MAIIDPFAGTAQAANTLRTMALDKQRTGQLARTNVLAQSREGRAVRADTRAATRAGELTAESEQSLAERQNKLSTKQDQMVWTLGASVTDQASWNAFRAEFNNSPRKEVFLEMLGMPKEHKLPEVYDEGFRTNLNKISGQMLEAITPGQVGRIGARKTATASAGAKKDIAKAKVDAAKLLADAKKEAAGKKFTQLADIVLNGQIVKVQQDQDGKKFYNTLGQTADKATDKAMTPAQINKTLISLQKGLAKLKTTKGADPLTIFLFKDNPNALSALASGDISEAVAEYERQIELYEKLRKGDVSALPADTLLPRTDTVAPAAAPIQAPLPDGLTEEIITFNMDKYNKTRQEVIDQYLKQQ